MSNQTQCPNCQAIFPMPASKLGDASARAKCGRCQHIFLLNENLVKPIAKTHTQPITTKPNPSVSPTATPTSPTRSPAPDDMIYDGMDDEEEETTPTKTTAFSEDELDAFLKQNIVAAPVIAKSTQDEMAGADDEAWLKDLLDDSKTNHSTTETKNTASNKPNNTANNLPNNSLDLDAIIPASPQPRTVPKVKDVKPQAPTPQQIATKKSVGSQLLWGLGCLLLLGMLGIQYVIFNMNSLVKNPIYAEKLQSVCNTFNCVIPSADIGAFKVDTAVKTHQGLANVMINLHNASDKEQLFPHLLVQLKNKDGAVVADFIASTDSYLPKGQTTLLNNQYKRIMLTASTDKTISGAEVKPFYQHP